MNLNTSSRPVRSKLPVFMGGLLGQFLVLAAAAGVLCAADPDPKSWDLDIRAEKAEYNPGETVNVKTGVVARAGGVQGWSYGVKHDPAVLTIDAVGIEGTDVPGVFNNGFNQTAIITAKDGTKKGFIQGLVLSLVSPAEVPVSEFFSMAAAKYTVSDKACDGKGGDFKTKIEYTEELGVPGSPPVDLNLTVDGISVTPAKVEGEEITVKCGVVPSEKLTLKFDKTKTELKADKASLYDAKILLENPTGAKKDVQGWSYGCSLDLSLIEATAGAPGADAAAVKGGNGPDFKQYNLLEQNVGGTVKGFTVGVVVDLSDPGTAVLPVPAGSTKHLDTIKIRSTITIPAGGQSKTTEVKFTDVLGADRPVEIVVVVGGEGLTPISSDVLVLTLVPGVVELPEFIRGDANNDARLDIADGIWIINNLYYGGKETECKAASDANDDGKTDLADAVYIFKYELQPGATPSTLFPAPPAPFPSCGRVAKVTFKDCPDGSTTCMK